MPSGNDGARVTLLGKNAMTQDVEDQRFMSINGFVQAIGPDDAQRSLHHETLIAAEFDRYHSGDPFQDLKHRARFSEEDQDLLKE